MIKDLFNKKAIAVICAATLSISSVALAFTTSGGYGMADSAASASASASAQPSDEPETPTESEPDTPPVKPSETPEKPTTDTPSDKPSDKPSDEPSTDPVELDTYQVVGTLVGTWDAGKGIYMTQSKDDANIYTATVLGVAANEYEYQVIKNDSWEEKYCGPTKGFANDASFANLKCNVKEACDVTVTLNLNDMTLKTSVDEEKPDQTDMSAATVTLEKSKVTFNNAVITPVVTKVQLGTTELKAGTDYEVEEIAPKNAGKYTVKVNGKGDYKGQACATFTIAARGINNSKTTATVSSKTYTGKKLTSSKYSLKVKIGSKTVTLKKGTDYTVKAVSRTSAGSSTVKFTGKGNYSGTKSAKFVVKPQSIKKAKVTVSNKVYTGKSLTTTVKVKLGSKTLKKNVGYKVSYSNNKKIGKATVTIKGKGNYTGTIKKSFKIVPGKSKIKKAVSVKGNKVKVQFSKVKGAKNYKVSYRIKGAKKWKAVTTKKTTVVLSKLKKNKTYQIKVTASAKSGKTTYTGSASSIKSVKVKK